MYPVSSPSTFLTSNSELDHRNNFAWCSSVAALYYHYFFLTVTLSKWNNCYYEINVLRLSFYTIFTRGDLTFYTESFTREGIKIREAGFQKFAWGCCRNFRRPVHCVLCKTKNFIRSSRTHRSSVRLYCHNYRDLYQEYYWPLDLTQISQLILRKSAKKLKCFKWRRDWCTVGGSPSPVAAAWVKQ